MRNTFLLAVLVFTVPSAALALLGTNSNACNNLYGLPPGTVAQGVDLVGTMSTDACAAKAYINGMSYDDLSGGRCSTPRDRVTGLDDAFAICAANFFKAYQEKYGKLTITTAYRPVSDNACRGGVGGSNHTRGMAIDVNPQDGNYEQLWGFSKANPQFGICFPHQNGGAGTTGYRDRPHMILAGIGGNEAAACARQGITRPCEAGKFDPNNIQEAAVNQGQVKTPTSNFSDMLRQYMGGNQPQPQAQQPGGSGGATGAVPATGAIPASSQPYQTAQPGYTAVPANTGVSGGGSSASAPSTIAIPSYQNPLSAPAPVSDQINAPQNNQPSNIADLLNALARPNTATTTIATGTPIALNPNIVQNIGTTYTNPQTIHTLQPATATPYALVPPVQTFTSPDLQYSQTNTGYIPPTNTTLAQRTLENLKQVLLKLLEVVRPFGRVQPLELEGE